MVDPLAILLLPLVEGAAIAIAAGTVCGTFVGATLGALNGWSRRVVEGNALRMGFQGAVWTLGIGLYDLCNVYASSL